MGGLWKKKKKDKSIRTEATESYGIDSKSLATREDGSITTESYNSDTRDEAPVQTEDSGDPLREIGDDENKVNLEQDREQQVKSLDSTNLFFPSSQSNEGITSTTPETENPVTSTNSKKKKSSKKKKRVQIKEIKDADERFMKGEFTEAKTLYTKALPIVAQKFSETDWLVGDIHVKIATIEQGKNRLVSAVEHLKKAQIAYEASIEEDDEDDTVSYLKLIEIKTNIANLFLDMGELNKANKIYQDVIELNRKCTRNSDIHIVTALNNYANFLSICKNDQINSLTHLKDALKIQQATHGKAHPGTASTLMNIGKIYLRRSVDNKGGEAQKHAKRAEACFVRALQLYRISMVRSGNEKVSEVLYNLTYARDLLSGKRGGILKNVRFEQGEAANIHEVHDLSKDAAFSDLDDEELEDELRELAKNSESINRMLKKRDGVSNSFDSYDGTVENNKSTEGFFQFFFPSCGNLDFADDNSIPYSDDESDDSYYNVKNVDEQDKKKNKKAAGYLKNLSPVKTEISLTSS